MCDYLSLDRSFADSSFTHKGAISAPNLKAEEKLPLSCIIAPPHALDNAILWGHANGLFMDSSWRNKNAHKAPMTVLATHDDYHRMVPSELDSS